MDSGMIGAAGGGRTVPCPQLSGLSVIAFVLLTDAIMSASI